MWFCDMRQMPRWRDIAYEFTVNIVKWFCEKFGPHHSRRGTSGTRSPRRAQESHNKSGQWGPYRQASPHRPGTAPALGLRVGNDVSLWYRKPISGKGESDVVS
jgi:hypothetical protein